MVVVNTMILTFQILPDIVPHLQMKNMMKVIMIVVLIVMIIIIMIIKEHSFLRGGGSEESMWTAVLNLPTPPNVGAEKSDPPPELIYFFALAVRQTAANPSDSFDKQDRN